MGPSGEGGAVSPPKTPLADYSIPKKEVTEKKKLTAAERKKLAELRRREKEEEKKRKEKPFILKTERWRECPVLLFLGLFWPFFNVFWGKTARKIRKNKKLIFSKVSKMLCAKFQL